MQIGQTKTNSVRVTVFSIVKSRYFLLSNTIAFFLVTVDFGLTIIGLQLGFYETRQYFYLHSVGLFIMNFAFFMVGKLTGYITMASRLSLLFSFVLPMLPIISNIMVLTNE